MSAQGPKQRIALYPGSFDPPTQGHINIIERGAKIFDKLVVGLLTNTSKRGIFTLEERVALLKELTSKLPNVQIDTFSGLLVDYMDQKGYDVVVRGIRTMTDFEYEFQMALSNKHLNDRVETVFMMTDAKYSHLSSSLIKEIIALGGDTKGMVPPKVEEALRARLRPATK